MEIKTILDNIIGGEAEDVDDHRSHASDVDSFHSLDTEQSEGLESDYGSSDAIREQDLEPTQSINSVEMDKLKLEKESPFNRTEIFKNKSTVSRAILLEFQLSWRNKSQSSNDAQQ